ERLVLRPSDEAIGSSGSIEAIGSIGSIEAIGTIESHGEATVAMPNARGRESAKAIAAELALDQPLPTIPSAGRRWFPILAGGLALGATVLVVVLLLVRGDPPVEEARPEPPAEPVERPVARPAEPPTKPEGTGETNETKDTKETASDKTATAP